MQRHEMIDAMAELGLKGMAGAFDETVTTGLQRDRTIMEILDRPARGRDRPPPGRLDPLSHERRQAAGDEGPGRLRLRRHADQRRTGPRCRPVRSWTHGAM